MLNAAGSRHDPIDLDEDDSFEDGEVTDSDEDDDDDDDDSDMYEAEALTINVQVDQTYRGKPRRAEVMFPVREAMSIYRRLYNAGFPLLKTRMERYGVQEDDILPGVESLPQANDVRLPQYSRISFQSDAVVASKPTAADEPYSNSSSYVSPASTSMSRQPSTSTATSRASTGASVTHSAARDYIFDWGVHSRKHFSQVPDNYLRTIAGNPVLLDKHPGVKEAFDYHRPGMRRPAPTKRQLAKQNGEPVQAPSRGGRNQGSRGQARTSWTTFHFPSGAHHKKKLNEVPENYLRTIEGMPHVMNKWAGLKEALQDYNMRTGRQARNSR